MSLGLSSSLPVEPNIFSISAIGEEEHKVGHRDLRRNIKNLHCEIHNAHFLCWEGFLASFFKLDNQRSELNLFCLEAFLVNETDKVGILLILRNGEF